MRCSFLLTSQVLLAWTLHLSAEASDLGSSLLPTSGSVEAKVMQIGVSKNTQRTADKIMAALSSQPAWAKAFIAANDKPGTPLPYHPNLKVTEVEYRAFLTAAARPALIQVGTVKLSAQHQQDGSIRLITLPPTSTVNGITISVNGKSVTTALATLEERKAVDNKDPEGATGRWTGTQWRHESTSPGRLFSVKFAIGKRTDHGDGIIYYDTKNVHVGGNDTRYEILLFPVSE